MQYSPLTQAIQGETVDAWDIHFRAIEAQERGKDVIVLSIGDPDFDTPKAVIESTIKGLWEGDTHYVEIEGRDILRDKIAHDHQIQSGQQVSKDNVILLAGAQNALFATCMCILEAGDEVIVLQPMYITYEACIQQTGARLVPVAMNAKNNFSLDCSALEKAITPKTKAIFFATPNNPSGAVLSRSELQFIADLAIKHDLWIVSDEVYSNTIFEGEHCSISGLPQMAERTVTLNSLSKSHAMTGWRVGWAIGPTELIAHLSNLSLCMLYGLPGFIQQGAYTALSDPEALASVEQMRNSYRKRRDTLIACFNKHPILTCVPPKASMFLLVNISNTGMTDLAFAEALFEQAGIAVLPASAFGKCAADYVRISYVVGDAQLDEACSKIDNFMRQFKTRPAYG